MSELRATSVDAAWHRAFRALATDLESRLQRPEEESCEADAAKRCVLCPVRAFWKMTWHSTHDPEVVYEYALCDFDRRIVESIAGMLVVHREPLIERRLRPRPWSIGSPRVASPGLGGLS